MPIKPPIALLVMSILLFLGCLFGSTFCTSSNCSDSTGFNALVAGWLGVLTLSPANLAWLANPQLFLSWVFIKMKMPRIAVCLGFGALIFGLLVLVFPRVEVDESGALRRIVGYGAGYWFWLLSMGFSILSAIVQKVSAK